MSKKSRTDEMGGALFPYNAYYDPIFGFRQNVFLDDIHRNAVLLAEQRRTAELHQPWRQNKRGANKTGSKYIP